MHSVLHQLYSFKQHSFSNHLYMFFFSYKQYLVQVFFFHIPNQMYKVGYSFSNPIYMFYHITKDFSVGIFYKPKQKYIIIQHRMF